MAANKYMKNNKASGYIKQLNRSFGYAVGDVFNAYAPTTSNLIKSSKSLVMETKSSMMKMRKGSISKSTQDMTNGNNNRHSNILDEIMLTSQKNIMSDSNDTTPKSTTEDWGDDETSEGTKELLDQNENNSKQLLNSISNLENSVSRIIGTSTAKSAEYIVKNQNESTKALYDLNKQGFTQITNVLLGMNDTITSIGSLTQPLTAHMHNSSVFFTTTSETLNKMQSSLEKIESKLTKASSGPGVKSKDKSYHRFADDYNTIDPKAWFGYIKENAKEQMDLVNKIFGDRKEKKTKKNVPLMQQAITTAIEFALPKFFKSYFKMYDDSIMGIFRSALSEAGIKFRKSKNPIAAILANIFLPRDNFRRSPRTGDYNKGQVAWDGIARKSVVEVIPTYLAKIYAALGGEEKYYDYKVGKFVTLKNIVGKQNYDYNKAAKAAGGEFRKDAIRKAKQSENPDIQKEIETYFQRALEKGTDFSDLKYNRNNKEFKESLGLTDESIKILIDLLDAYKKSPIKAQDGFVRNRATNFRSEVARQRTKLGAKMSNAEATGDIGLNYVYNGFGSSDKKVGSSFIDKNGNTSLDYLRGIYSMLGSGFLDGKFRRGIKFKLGKITDKGFILESEKPKNNKNNSDKMNYKYYGMSDDDIDEAKEQEKIEDAWEHVRDELMGKNDKALKSKRKEYEGDSKFRKALSKARNVYEKPFELFGRVISVFSNGLNDLFWGTEGKPGLVERLYNKFDEFTTNFKDKIHEKFKKWFGESESVGSFKDQFKATWQNVKDNVKDSARNAKNKFLYGTTVAQQLKNIRRDSGIGTAATGRKVTKSGVVVVSEGEMIIPSELNPYYHGITNKRAQIDNENKIASRFLGTFARGGEPGKEYIYDEKTGEFYEKAIDENGKTIRGAKVTSPEEKKKAGTSMMDHLKRNTIGKIFERDEFGKFKNTADSAMGVIGQGAGMLGSGIVRFVSECFGREDPEKDKEKVMGVIKDSFSEMGNNKGAMAIGALGGVGVSLLTGGLIGPIAAGAIGAGVGLVSKSETIQNKLFGYTDEKGNFQEGLFKKDTAEFLKNSVPAIGKGGAVGGVLGAFAGSPVLGAIVGGTMGYVSSSEKARTFLFGNDEKDGVISKELQKKVKDAAPNMAAGALAGLLVGPFGVVGNIMVGAGLGYLSKSEEFGKFLFGDENGEGGLAQKIRDNIIGNLNDIFRNMGNRIKGFGKNLGRTIQSKIKTFGQSIKEKIERKAKSKDGSIGSKIAGAAYKVINAPFDLAGLGLGAINKRIQKGNLRKGYDVYNAEEKRNATAEEREQMREKYGMRSSKTDQVIASINRKEDMIELQQAIKDLRDPKNIFRRARSKELTELYKVLRQNGIEQKDIEKIGNLVKGDNGAARAIQYLEECLKNGRVAKLENKSAKKQISDIKAAIVKCNDNILKAKNDKNAVQNARQAIKDKYGIDTSETGLMKAGDLIDTELKNNSKFSDEAQAEMKTEKHQTVVESYLEKILEAIKIVKGSTTDEFNKNNEGKITSSKTEDGKNIFYKKQADGTKVRISREEADQLALNDTRRTGTEKLYDAKEYVRQGIESVGKTTSDAIKGLGSLIEKGAEKLVSKLKPLLTNLGNNVSDRIDSGIKTSQEEVTNSRELEDYTGGPLGRAGRNLENVKNRTGGFFKGTFGSSHRESFVPESDDSGSGSKIKNLFRKLSGGDSEPKVHTEFTMAGPVQYVLNNQGEATIDDRDKETQETMKKTNSFFDAIKSVPFIGSAIGGLNGLMGKLKDGLLGNEEENKEGLISKLMNKLVGDEGILSGLFGFFTNAKQFGKKLLSKITLKSVFSNVIAPALLIGGFTGKFDELGKKITDGAYGNKDDEKSGTTKDGRTVTATTDENGNTVWKDEDGNIVDDSEVVSVSTRKMDSDSVASKLRKNVARETLKGRNSITSKVLKKTALGKKISGSKLATRAKDMVSGKTEKAATKAAEKMTQAEVIKKAGSMGQDALDDLGTAALQQANGVADDAIGNTTKKLAKEAGEKAVDSAFSSSIMESLQSAAEKLAPKLAKLGVPEESTTKMFSAIGAKVSKAFSSNAAKTIAKTAGQVVVVARIAFVVMDFVTGYEDARTTLGITKNPTTGQRILAGVLRVVKNLIPVVGSFIPDSLVVNVACDYIAPALGIDVSELKQSREEAKKDVEAYNQANGTNISSVEEFNKSVLKDYTTTERIGNAIKSTREDAKQKRKNRRTLIKEKGFKGYMSETMSNMSSTFIEKYKEEGGGLAGISAGISEAFGNQMPGLFGNITKANGQIKAKGFKGNLKEMWKVSLPNFSGGGEDVKGTNLKTAVPSLFSKIVGQIPLILAKVEMTPIALISALGNKIKDTVSKKMDNIRKASDDVVANNDKLKEISNEGKLSELWKNKVDISEDNPLKGYMIFSNFSNKLLYTVPTLFHKMGNAFSNFTSKISSKNESNLDSYTKAQSELQKYSKKGNIKKVRSVSFNLTEDTPVGKMLKASFWIEKQYYTVIGLFNKMANGIKSVGGKIKDVWNSIFNKNKSKDTDSTDTSTSGGSSGFVSQFDPKYQKYSIYGNNFASKGCGPAVASMAAQSMGKSLSVGDAVSQSTGYQNKNGVSADYFGKVFAEKGIRTRYISGGSSEELYSSIANGDKVVLLGQDRFNRSKENSPFGPNNHYVLATGLDRNGNVVVNDPESNAPRAYNPSILKSAKLGIAGSSSGLKRISRRKRLLNRISGGDSYDTDVARQVWAFWTGAGYSAAATAGIMGNIYQESGMDPSCIQGNGKGPAAGLFQWENYNTNSGRFANMKSYASSKGKDWKDLDSQLNFAKSEFESNDCTRILEGKAGKSSEIFSHAGISVSKAMSLDQFKKISDVALACALFEAAFERAGKPNMNRRQQAAAAYYNLYSGSHYEYTGTYDSADSSSSSSGSSKSLFTNSLSLLSDVSTVFSDAFGALDGSSDDSDSSSSSSTSGSDTVVSNAAVGDGNETQKKIVQKLLDIQGTLKYSMSGPRDPEKGSADCSSTINWAYKKVTGKDIGGSTDGIINNSNTEIIDLANNMDPTNGGSNSSGPTESKLMPGDILLYSRPDKGYSAGRKYRVGHVEMYVGNGKRIGHGGGADGKKLGPTVSSLSTDSNRYIEARRLKGITDSGNGSGLMPIDYNDLAMASGGSSGLLLSSRVGSNNIDMRRLNKNMLIRKTHNFSGGDSNIADETTAMLNNIKQNVQTRASSGSISTDTVNRLIKSITNLLQSIADNTADISSIYNVLKSYVAGGGSNNDSNKDTAIKKTKVKPSTVSSSIASGSDEIDSNIVSLVGVLADIAKG